MATITKIIAVVINIPVNSDCQCNGVFGLYCSIKKPAPTATTKKRPKIVIVPEIPKNTVGSTLDRYSIQIITTVKNAATLAKKATRSLFG